jgi:hypothetical protein
MLERKDSSLAWTSWISINGLPRFTLEDETHILLKEIPLSHLNFVKTVTQVSVSTRASNCVVQIFTLERLPRSVLIRNTSGAETIQP